MFDFRKIVLDLGMMADTCNFSRRLSQEFEDSLGFIVNHCL